MSDEDCLRSALNISRRMPPASIDISLSGLINLCPKLTDELLQRVDQPLKIEKDPSVDRYYILCDYNRDGDSYRSPHSNKYFPPLEDGFVPSDHLRKMEIVANNIFDRYRNLYFDGGHSSVYFQGLTDTNFASCQLINKAVDSVRGLNSGSWDSIHVVEACDKKNGSFEYKLITTVIISMNVDNDDIGTVDLSGSMTKQLTQTVMLDNDERTHIGNIGKMIEKIELQVRQAIEGVYIQKTREVINGMRSASENGKMFKNAMLDELYDRVKSR